MSEPRVPARRATLEDVAKAAGVSVSTVDRVMSLRANVRADTAQRIAEAAAQLGFYGRNVIEQRLLQHRPVVRIGLLLQKRGVAFYQGLAKALTDAAAASVRAQVRVMVGYIDDLDPAATAERILALQHEIDALGVVAADHPAVAAAVAHLRAAGLPVIAMVSQLSAAAGAGYVGVDNRRMGRTAAWFITRLARQPGAVAVMVGTQRFQCQELCELSFRSALAEQGADWELLATRLTLEDAAFAYAGTLDLLTSEPGLAGLYVGGGGIEGVIKALREYKARQAVRPVVVCHDLTPLTRAALREGVLDAVLSHPVEALAQATISRLVQAAIKAPDESDICLLPIQIDVPESA
ncbi:LacI family DNA-binding transcriptional regulator [Pseudomonas syringae]|nr:LacI family DNA-binding transcriptional regulator [Pseudomonas syringae]MBD8790358.1 LacI family DNA-binding transcriptional regulator [Pseudomonas syringae]MBD8799144.1 LacI family DNA-binding transcriptional regulator [Pseudomonas syringae]MBD8809970.1 LacI family DNA-binding transcriptional regulator [Pseudomonas syringae]